MDALLEGLNGDHIKREEKRRKRGESGGREGKKERREKNQEGRVHTEGEGDEDGSTILPLLPVLTSSRCQSSLPPRTTSPS